MLRPNSCPINSPWWMPGKAYRPIIHPSRCCMPSGTKSRKIEKSSIKEWLSNTTKDSRSCNILKNCCQNHQSHKISWWCWRIQWQAFVGQSARCSRSFLSNRQRMISWLFTRARLPWLQRKNNKLRTNSRLRSSKCPGYKLRSVKKKNKSIRSRASGLRKIS